MVYLKETTLSLLKNFFQGEYLSPRKYLSKKLKASIVQLIYNNLKTHIRSKIGQYKTYQGIPIRCKQRKGTHCTIRSLMVKNKSGSVAYRKIISRGDKKADINYPTTWRKKLDHIKSCKNNAALPIVKSSSIRCK